MLLGSCSVTSQKKGETFLKERGREEGERGGTAAC